MLILFFDTSETVFGRILDGVQDRYKFEHSKIEAIWVTLHDYLFLKRCSAKNKSHSKSKMINCLFQNLVTNIEYLSFKILQRISIHNWNKIRQSIMVL